MTTPSRKSPSAGGVFIAVLSLAGAIGGGLLGQPTIGLLVGIAAGVVLALALWLRDRAR